MSGFSYDYAVLGGDQRQEYLSSYWQKQGKSVILYGLQQNERTNSCDFASSVEEAINQASTIVGPVPFSRDGETIVTNIQNNPIRVSQIVECLSAKQQLIAGCIPKSVIERCISKNILYFDIMNSEELTIFNAIATAEGAIAEMIKRSDSNLHLSKCLVTGYGRCAKVLAKKLDGLDMKVDILARASLARAEAEAFGYNAYSLQNINDNLSQYSFIFNTIPALIFKEAELKQMKKDVVIIDIASSPGGIDYKAAEQLEIGAYLCLGLPGKYSPKSSAVAIAKVVEHFLNEFREM